MKMPGFCLVVGLLLSVLSLSGNAAAASTILVTNVAESLLPNDNACNPLNFKQLSPGLLHGQCGWSTIQPDTGVVVGADHLKVRDDTIVLIGDQRRIDYWGWVAIPPQDDVFSVKLRVRVDNQDARTPPNFSLNIDDSVNYPHDGRPWPIFGELGVMMYLRGWVGMVMGRDGDGQGKGAFKSVNVVPYLGNATYTMQATIDPSRGTYDMQVWVDGEPPVVVADDYRFRRNPIAGSFNSISMWVAGQDVHNEPVRVTIEKISIDEDDD